MNNDHRTSAEIQKAIEQQLQQVYANYQSGMHAQAETLCREVLDQHPKHPMALLMLGMLSIAQNRVE